MDAIDRAVRIGRQYDEKAHQVSPNSLTIFGIDVCSRYGKCEEIEELLAFCRECAGAGAATYIESVFYDSKSCCANITFEAEAVDNWTIVREVEEIAERTLGQFDCQDGSVRGKHMSDEPPE